MAERDSFSMDRSLHVALSDDLLAIRITVWDSDAETRPPAKAIVAMALARGIALDEAFDLHDDAATLGKMLEAADQITDFHAYASEIGIEDPNHELRKRRRQVPAPNDPGSDLVRTRRRQLMARLYFGSFD